MKKLLTAYSILALLITSFLACEPEVELTTLAKVEFPSVPEVNPSSIVLLQNEADQPAITISWDRVQYPVDAPVSYKVQFDVANDTLGDNAWGDAITIDAGVEVLSKSLIVSELNDITEDLGLESEVEGTLLIRVQSYLDRAVNSKPITLEITPYTAVIPNTSIYVPGAYQGWNPATADSIPATATNGVFKGILSFPEPDKLEFKITLEKNWDNNYGGDASGNLIFDGPNLSVPNPGTYEITINLNTLKWSVVPFSYGVIGTSQPGGWDVDSDMYYSSKEQAWKFIGELQPGALKFRLNDSWDVNYGPRNNDEGIAYLDDPGAHTIYEAGVYEVTFQINPLDNTQAFYSVEPVSWGVIGDATPGGWDSDTDMYFVSYNQSWKFVGELQPGALKFRLNDSWDINYGPRNNDEGIAYLDDPGAHGVSEAGVYEVTFKVNPSDPSMADYSVQKISWGIIGDATAGGWDVDTDMMYNGEQGYWEITTDLNPGAVKFRLNDSWTINYGPQNNDDGIAYLDDPGAHGISQAGSYHITFMVDPQDPSIAHYSVELSN